MDKEPSVLDYIIAKLKFWESNKAIDEWLKSPPAAQEGETKFGPLPDVAVDSPTSVRPTPEHEGVSGILRFLPLLALALALLAQVSLEPGADRSWGVGLFLYIAAVGLVVYSNRAGSLFLAAPNTDVDRPFRPVVRYRFLLLAAIFAVGSIAAFRVNRFNMFNLLLWAASILSIIYSFLQTEYFRELPRKIRSLFKPDWKVHLSAWGGLLLLAGLIAIFFRTYQLVGIPGEMVSDHAEKLYDVRDLLSGETLTFFPRNTGREFFQFYLTAWIIRTFHTGITFLSLKIGTVSLGLLTLPFIYLIGKEIGSRRLGLIALAFAGIAYWPNLISRIALRFTLYPFFYAPALYFLLRGLRTKRTNNFIWAGLFMGLGLHGYSPYRMVPLAVIAMILIYVLHNRSNDARFNAFYGLTIAGITTFIVVIPLFVYFLSNPDMVLYRSLTRVSDLERALPGNPVSIFLSNNLRALTMFAWDNGEVWVISVVGRPILDIVSAALFHIGVGLVLFRYIRKRYWHDLFILVSIPILLLPSTLSIAFPSENPSLNRTAAALVPVFLLVGYGLDGVFSSLGTFLNRTRSQWAVLSLGLILFALSALQNYDLVFHQYAEVYRASSWNTTELGQVVKDFTDLVGTPDTAWLVAYPHWVDSRLVMINAGYPYRDNALFPEHFNDTLPETRPKLFLLNIQDEANLQTLTELYPKGWVQRYQSQVETKDFWIYLVPPTDP